MKGPRLEFHTMCPTLGQKVKRIQKQKNGEEMNNSNKILAILVVLAMSAVVGFTAVTAEANASDDDKIDTY